MTMRKEFILAAASLFLTSVALCDPMVRRTYHNKRYGYLIDYYTNPIFDDMSVAVKNKGRTVELPNITLTVLDGPPKKNLKSAVKQAAAGFKGESGNSIAVCKPEDAKTQQVIINGLNAYEIVLIQTASIMDKEGNVEFHKVPLNSPIYLIDISNTGSSRSLLAIGSFWVSAPGASEKLEIMRSVRIIEPKY